jgi:16S rRNA (guanine527-N7)-methyltransferase
VSDREAGPGGQSPGPASGLFAVLTAAQQRGFIGGPELGAHVRQAEALAAAVGSAPSRVLDLGSGGGLPGLVLASCWPTAEVTLLDGGTARAAFLSWAVAELGCGDRVAVAAGRAEELGRTELRGGFDLVVARSFGPPAVVAECGAPFLAVGGWLLVSEPPDSDGSRWDHPAELAALGLAPEPVRERDGHRFQPLQATTPCPNRYPRRTGIPTKRPLF